MHRWKEHTAGTAHWLNKEEKRTEKESPISSHQATWVFLRRPEELTAEEQHTLVQLRNLDPEVDLAYKLVQHFARMLRERTGKEQLDGWLEKVASSPLSALHPFVAGISQVQAGLTLDWSQGQTERQITRLKLIKRQGYGKASFDLLCKQVCLARQPRASVTAIRHRAQVPW
ncbi:MAG TPA: transposase [Ktedonobacteraceae bacterium]|nr:transposase [Ktedonobacteraceae bacterium]